MTKAISDETKEEKIADKQNQTQIITAVISSLTTLIIGLAAAFLGFQPFQDWVRSWGDTDESEPLLMEEIPYYAYSFEGDDEPSCCVGRAYFDLTNDSNLQPIYGFGYLLPEEETKHGYAGFVFEFDETQNLSEYKALEFKIYFDNEINEMDVTIADNSSTEISFHITGKPGQPNSIIVPLINFSGIEFKAVHSIAFEVNSDYTSGNHWFDISEIRLTK